MFIRGQLGNFPYSYYRNSQALGSPENWNSAIGKAGGKYIKVMHHDDFFTGPDSLGLMVGEIEKEKAAFMFCQTDVWDLATNSHRIHTISDKQLKLLKRKPQFLFFINVIGAPSATLYLNNKSFRYDKRLKWLVDVDFYMQYLFHSQKIVHLPLPLICTATNTEGQVTVDVINDRYVQIKEHVFLFNKISVYKLNERGFMEFFDHLFFKYQVGSFQELEAIVPEAIEKRAFYNRVISSLNSFRAFKQFKKRFFGSRYNYYYFKMEQYL
jgi:hypothetical protein